VTDGDELSPAVPEATPAARPPMSSRKVALVFFGILLGTTLSGLDAAIVATAAPTIIADLGDLSLLPWLTTAYLLCQVTTMPVYGKLGDIYRRKRMFIIAICTFLAGSALCGLSTSMAMLIVCRGLQGVGAGGITGLGMALVADLVPSEKLGRYLGYTGLVFAATSVLGPFVGGLFVDHLSWRWAFYINVPLGVVCLVALIYQPAQAVIVKHRIDVLGALLLGGGVTCLLLALSHTGADAAWTSPRTLALLAAFVVAIAAFVAWERRVAEPLLPLRILATRITALCTFANLVAGVGFTCGIIYPPVFFQAVAGVDASKSGLLLAPFAFTCAVSTLAAGQITDRVGGYKALPLIGMVFLGAGYALLGTITAATSAAEVMAFAMVAGVGVGFVMQTLLYVVQRSSSVRDIGVATSTVMLFRVLGSSLGVAVLGSAFTSSLTSEVDTRLPGFPTSEIQGAPQKIAALAPEVQQQLHDAFASSLATAFRVAVPFMVVGFVAVAFIPGRAVKRRMAEAHEPLVSAEAVAHGA
jgi:EmrB/QacA subfamily drug resistance transporter